MRKTLGKILVLSLTLIVLSGCVDKESKNALIDVNAVISNGAHAQQAAQHLAKAQEIYQYNLNVIEKKLGEYENKQQAQAYLVEAARQLQAQLNNSKMLVTQSLLNALNTVLEGQKQIYDLIVKKDGIIHVNEGTGGIADKFKAMPEDITTKIRALYGNVAITLPPLPAVVENPNLPADLGADVPFPPVQAEENPAESTELVDGQ